jgi:NitT/TauT family transport system ATP-binding protein
MIEVRDLSKAFSHAASSVPVLDNVNFTVERGEFVSVVGSSGCGKTTLLNIIAGVIPPDKGEVLVNGERVQKVRRSVGYTFQQANLLPWRTIQSNVELGLELRGVSKNERRARARELLNQVGLSQFAESYPHQVSGGMAKRAEIARVLAIDPELLLMDEPFGALDAQTKLHMHDSLLKLLQEFKKTVIFITHDLDEAVVLSDTVITMSARPGRIKNLHKIDLRRPRDSRGARLDRRFQDILGPIWEDIESAASER